MHSMKLSFDRSFYSSNWKPPSLSGLRIKRKPRQTHEGTLSAWFLRPSTHHSTSHKHPKHIVSQAKEFPEFRGFIFAKTRRLWSIAVIMSISMNKFQICCRVSWGKLRVELNERKRPTYFHSDTCTSVIVTHFTGLDDLGESTRLLWVLIFFSSFLFAKIVPQSDSIAFLLQIQTLPIVFNNT